MLPNWLEVPAAEYDKRHAERASIEANPLLALRADDWGESVLSAATAPARSCGSAEAEGAGPRLAIFVSDPPLAAALARLVASRGGLTIARSALGCDALLWLHRQDFDMEILEPGMLALPTPAESYGGDRVDVSCRETAGRHWVDVALSMGRHAAERAKLAGCRQLGCAAPRSLADCVEGGLSWRRTEGRRQSLVRSKTAPLFGHGDCQKVYDWIFAGESFERAAMVGAMVACAQMGLEAVVCDAQARVAAIAAGCLCLGAAPWLKDAAAAAGPRQEAAASRVEEARLAVAP